MTVEQSDVVDSIGVDIQSGSVVLTVSDHLDWGQDEEGHLRLLQDKLNTYLRFVESGELHLAYSDAKGRPVLVEVVFKHAPSHAAREFLSRARAAMSSAGMMLTFTEMHL